MINKPFHGLDTSLEGITSSQKLTTFNPLVRQLEIVQVVQANMIK